MISADVHSMMEIKFASFSYFIPRESCEFQDIKRRKKTGKLFTNFELAHGVFVCGF